jgi:hypothetical protein
MHDNIFSPGPTPNTVRAGDGRILTVPVVACFKSKWVGGR